MGESRGLERETKIYLLEIASRELSRVANYSVTLISSFIRSAACSFDARIELSIIPSKSPGFSENMIYHNFEKLLRVYIMVLREENTEWEWSKRFLH